MEKNLSRAVLYSFLNIHDNETLFHLAKTSRRVFETVKMVFKNKKYNVSNVNLNSKFKAFCDHFGIRNVSFKGDLSKIEIENNLTFPEIVELNLISMRIYDFSLERVVKLFPEIREISIDSCFLGPNNIKHLSKLSKLREVKLNFNHLKEEGLSTVLSMDSLKAVHVNKNKIEFSTIIPVKALNITYLSIRDNKIGILGFKTISQLKYLEYLDIGLTSVNSEGLTAISVLKNIKTLILDSNALIAEDMKLLWSFIKLDVLVLNLNKIGKAGCYHLSNLKSLTSLHLDFCGLDTQDVVILSNLSRLEELSLAYNSIQDEELAILAAIKTIKKIKVSGTECNSYKWKKSKPKIIF